MILWLLLSCGDGWLRIVDLRDDDFRAAIFDISKAAKAAAETARPAYREMIDTLDWGAIL